MLLLYCAEYLCICIGHHEGIEKFDECITLVPVYDTLRIVGTLMTDYN